MKHGHIIWLYLTLINIENFRDCRTIPRGWTRYRDRLLRCYDVTCARIADCFTRLDAWLPVGFFAFSPTLFVGVNFLSQGFQSACVNNLSWIPHAIECRVSPFTNTVPLLQAVRHFVFWQVSIMLDEKVNESSNNLSPQTNPWAGFIKQG